MSTTQIMALGKAYSEMFPSLNNIYTYLYLRSSKFYYDYY